MTAVADIDVVWGYIRFSAASTDRSFSLSLTVFSKVYLHSDPGDCLRLRQPPPCYCLPATLLPVGHKQSVEGQGGLSSSVAFRCTRPDSEGSRLRQHWRGPHYMGVYVRAVSNHVAVETGPQSKFRSRLRLDLAKPTVMGPIPTPTAAEPLTRTLTPN